MEKFLLKIKKGYVDVNGYQPIEIKFKKRKFYYYANNYESTNKIDKQINKFMERLGYNLCKKK